MHNILSGPAFSCPPTRLELGIYLWHCTILKKSWCSGCCLSRHRKWQSMFSFLVARVSMSGLIFRAGPALVGRTASFAFFMSKLLRFVLSTNVVRGFWTFS